MIQQVPSGYECCGDSGGLSSGTAVTLGHSGAGDGGGREEVVAVCRYQYEQWKRGGHLHNKAINGILNHKTVILPDPQIKKTSERVGERDKVRGKRRQRESKAYSSRYI